MAVPIESLTYNISPTLHHIEHHAPAHYEFAYSVHDPHTGDVKDQHETRNGDQVQGHYSLVEPDGHRRTVHYKADAHNGFNAVVYREGTAHHTYHHITPVALVYNSLPVAHHSSAVSHQSVGHRLTHGVLVHY